MAKGREPATKKEKNVVNKMQLAVANVGNKLPRREVVVRDWRFWLAVILGLSVFSAAVGGSINQSIGGNVGQI